MSDLVDPVDEAAYIDLDRTPDLDALETVFTQEKLGRAFLEFFAEDLLFPQADVAEEDEAICMRFLNFNRRSRMLVLQGGKLSLKGKEPLVEGELEQITSSLLQMVEIELPKFLRES